MKSKKLIIRTLELLFIALWVFPLAWMLITSLKLEEEVITKTFTFWPQNPSLANYIKAFTSTYIVNWMGNSFIVSLFAMLLTLAVDAPIAYAFAKIPFKGRNVLFWLVMGGMMVPFQVLIVPLYLQFNSYGWSTLWLQPIFPGLRCLSESSSSSSSSMGIPPTWRRLQSSTGRIGRGFSSRSSFRWVNQPWRR